MRLKPSQLTPTSRATKNPNAISTLIPVESLRIAWASRCRCPGNVFNVCVPRLALRIGNLLADAGVPTEKLFHCRLNLHRVELPRMVPRRKSYPDVNNSSVPYPHAFRHGPLPPMDILRSEFIGSATRGETV